MMSRHWIIGTVLLACTAAVHAAQVSDAGALAVGDFFKASVFRNANLSFDGKSVAVVNYPDGDKEFISIIDLGQLTSTDIVTAADKREYFSGLEWVSNDTLIFYDHIGDAMTKLVAVQWGGLVDGKPQVKITVWPGNYWIVDRLVHDGKHVLLGDNTNSCLCIYRADLNAGPEGLGSSEKVYSLDPKTFWVVTDKEGAVKVMATRDQDDGPRHYLHAVTDAGGKTSWKEFKSLTDDKQVFTPELVAPDGRHFYVFSNIDRNSTGYFEYDPNTDKYVKTIYANDDADVTDFRYDPIEDTLLYVTWYAGTDPHYEILDERAKYFIPALRDAFPGQQVIPWDISADGKEVLVYVYSDVNSGTYYAFNLDKRQAELLGAEQPWLDPTLMSPVREGKLKTQDGFDLNYLIATPKGQKGPFPLVVIPHGGPIGVFNVNGFDAETQLLVSRGYAVLKINYRGSGGSGKQFEKAGNHQWGRKIEDDIEETVHLVMRTEPVDKDRICIFGASYGGYSALMSVIRDPSLYKCAASYAGVTDLPLLYDTTNVQFDQKVKDDLADIIGDPTTDADKLKAVSPVYLADKIKRPVFMAQGGRDTRVDEEQAYRLKLAMETLKIPLEFQYYPSEIHGFRYTDDETDFYLRLLDFLGRNIASNRPVAPPPAP